MAEKNLFGGSEREYSHPTVEGPWGRAPNTEPTHAWPVLPAGWNPEGKPGHGPGDIARYYPRSGGDYELPTGKMIADSRGRMMDPEGFVTEGWQGTPRPVSKTHWWPTKLGNRYRNEAFNESMGVNVSGYPEDEFGGFVEDYGNPHADRFPWELEPEWTGETSPFFPPLTIGDYPTGEFGEEIIEEDDGSWNIWDFIQQFFPGVKAGKGIETFMENKQQSNLDNWDLFHLMSNGYTLEEAQEIIAETIG